MNRQPLVIETQRLILRKVVDEDLGAFRSIFGDAEVMKFGSGPKSDTWIADWITNMQANYTQRGYGLWAVVLRETDQPIGYCGLTYFPDINGQPEVEVGYRLARVHWAKGYATEAATAVKDWAFHERKMERLIALIDPANVASVRVAEKLGMVHEADVMLEGYTYPDRVYVCHNSGSHLR